ncbi:MAG TPA: LysR substrate-binding domain-containing protein [Steroidobacteraceae bacterium]
MRSPSLKLLKTFHIVASHGSFKAAADILCVTSAAVSQQIKLLEQQLGLTLFERKANSLTLTEAGVHYRASIQTLFARIDLATEQVRRRFSRSVVRLQVPSFFSSELLVPRLPTFIAAQPDIDLQISTPKTSVHEHPDNTDVSVVVRDGAPSDMYAACLFLQVFVPVANPHLLHTRNISTTADVVDQVLVVDRSRPDLWDRWAAASGIGELRPRQMIRFDSLSAVVQAAEQGVGIALVSAPLATARIAAGTLRRIMPAELATGESYFVTARHDDMTRTETRALVDWLKQLTWPVGHEPAGHKGFWGHPDEERFG